MKEIFDLCIVSLNGNSKAQYTMGWELEKKVLHREHLAEAFSQLADRLETELSKGNDKPEINSKLTVMSPLSGDSFRSRLKDDMSIDRESLRLSGVLNQMLKRIVA